MKTIEVKNISAILDAVSKEYSSSFFNDFAVYREEAEHDIKYAYYIYDRQDATESEEVYVQEYKALRLEIYEKEDMAIVELEPICVVTSTEREESEKITGLIEDVPYDISDAASEFFRGYGEDLILGKGLAKAVVGELEETDNLLYGVEDGVMVFEVFDSYYIKANTCLAPYGAVKLCDFRVENKYNEEIVQELAWGEVLTEDILEVEEGEEKDLLDAYWESKGEISARTLLREHLDNL